MPCDPTRDSRKLRPLGRLAVLCAMLLALTAVAGCGASNAASAPSSERVDPRAANSKLLTVASQPPLEPTFHRDIAPIVFEHCAACHRPQGSGPFSLLTYADVKNRSQQIAKVTKSRFMPPWLPKDDGLEFIGDCHLTDEQIETIGRWVVAGAVEGNPADSPPPPKWREGWLLGEPDLVVTMPRPFHLAASGSDTWRQFIIPIPVNEPRYVRAVEIHPGNKRIVHHATVHIDTTNSSRGLDGKDGEPGYDGMVASSEVHSPDGHFLSWLPGMIPFAEDPEMAWRMEPGTEFVVETHMLPSGKPELVQESIGIYFSDQPPKKFPVQILLHSEQIDIPAGSTDFEATDSYVLPIDVELLGMHPHAHLLGKEVEAWATTPDGSKKVLLTIPHWDFAWQNAYRFKHPVALRAGTKLSMRIRYDNSADNVRNPHQPPERVHYGFRSHDEMAQVTFQVLPKSAAQARKLAADFRKHDFETTIRGCEYRLKFDDKNPRLRVDLGRSLFVAGRPDDALDQLQQAVKLDPNDPQAHYFLGLVHYMLKDTKEAKSEFEAAIRVDPEFYLAHGELGLWHLEHRNIQQAKKCFLRSLELHQHDAVVHNNLGTIFFQLGKPSDAEREIREALRI
ncbi:MAG TPA: tetratricopeptide repeat protein, partial [Pirellulales bacterium]